MSALLLVAVLSYAGPFQTPEPPASAPKLRLTVPRLSPGPSCGGFECADMRLVGFQAARPIAVSVDRVVAGIATDQKVGAVRGFDDVRKPPPNKGESFFSPQNLLLGAGLAAAGWWDVKTSYDCFSTPSVETRRAVPGGIEVTTRYCYESNSRMAKKFAQGSGAVYRDKAINNGSLWVGSWFVRWAGGKLGKPFNAIGNVVGFAAPAAGIGIQVRLAIRNRKVIQDLENRR